MAPATSASPTEAAVRVMFCSRIAAAPDAEHGDGNHRRRNGGGDGLPRLHAQVGVGRAENQRQEEAQPHGFEGHLGRVGGMLRVRHKGGWYHAVATARQRRSDRRRASAARDPPDFRLGARWSASSSLDPLGDQISV